MQKVLVVTSNTRGFLKTLFDFPFRRVRFQYNQDNIYQKFSRKKQILYRIYGKMSWTGYFQVIRCANQGQDIGFSYNRFLKSEKPYVIYLESPDALVNYQWKMITNGKSSRRIEKCLSDQNLKAIVCMSKACMETMPIYYQLPEHIKIFQVYPLVLKEPSWTIENVRERARQEKLECLFVSQSFFIKGGEVAVEAILRLEKENYPIHLTMITKTRDVCSRIMDKINHSSAIDIVEFGLSKEELNDYYKKAAVLLHPSQGDSCPLTVIEAMKYGCALVTSDIYALKEMVEEEKNGYLLSPCYRGWKKDNTIDLEWREHHKKIIATGFMDVRMVENIQEILKKLCTDRDHLSKLCVGSYEKATSGEFSEEYISDSWEHVWEVIQ